MKIFKKIFLILIIAIAICFLVFYGIKFYKVNRLISKLDECKSILNFKYSIKNDLSNENIRGTITRSPEFTEINMALLVGL